MTTPPDPREELRRSLIDLREAVFDTPLFRRVGRFVRWLNGHLARFAKRH